MPISPVYLRRDKAAQHIRETWGLPCSPRWLAKLAVVGGGPIYRKAGRTPIYAPADLDALAQARIGAPEEVVFGQGVSAPYGEASPQLPASQNPSQLFGGRNCPPVSASTRTRSGHGSRTGLTPIDKSRAVSCPWARLGRPFSRGDAWAGKRPSPPGHLYCFKCRAP